MTPLDLAVTSPAAPALAWQASPDTSPFYREVPGPEPSPSSIGAGKEPSPYLLVLCGEMPLSPGMCLLPSAAHAGTPGSPFHANSPLALAKQHGFDDK